MDPSFIYEAKGQILIIHMPAELDHHNCRNLRYETDLLMAENYIAKLIFDFSRTSFMDSFGIRFIRTDITVPIMLVASALIAAVYIPFRLKAKES